MRVYRGVVEELAKLRTIRELARTLEVPHRKLARILRKLHALSLERGHEEWRFRTSVRGEWLVNMSLLQRAHPSLFFRNAPRRDEFEELKERVGRLEQVTTEQRRHLNGVASRLRDVQNVVVGMTNVRG